MWDVFEIVGDLELVESVGELLAEVGLHGWTLIRTAGPAGTLLRARRVARALQHSRSRSRLAREVFKMLRQSGQRNRRPVKVMERVAKRVLQESQVSLPR